MIIDNKISPSSAIRPKVGSATIFVDNNNELKIKTSENQVVDPIKDVATEADLATRPTIIKDSVGNFIGLQDPESINTISTVPAFSWSSKPLPSAFIGRAFITDIAGGKTFISNGTRWYPEGGIVNLDVLKTEVVNGGSTTETLFHRTLIRAGLLQDGDKVRIYASFSKVGNNTEISDQRWKIGTAGLATDPQLVGPAKQVSTTNYSSGFLLEFKRISATQMRKVGNSNIGGAYNGSSTGQVATSPTTVLNMDDNDFYISFTNQPDGTANTYTLHDYSMELITGV